MDFTDKETKRIIVEVPIELHQKFKSLSYDEGKTIREIVLKFIKAFVENREKSKAKEKKKSKAK